ncbi:muskelin-like isoform X2 [Sycon ciliatum]|uniref:muskelin-like isoform X2 n=1 Tax=Sycon ciliatum TaxID=27933 RepID=UPI0031F6891F
MQKTLESVKLSYSVHKWSSYHPGFHPRNIRDSAAPETRWMTRSNVPPQFVILKLDNPAVVESVSFINRNVAHVCQLRFAKVYGGLNEDQFVELGNLQLVQGSPTNCFSLLPVSDKSVASLQRCVPCIYFKIVPLESYDKKFNLSIWNVELSGYASPTIVVPACTRLNKYLEEESMRLCMKFLRDKCHIDVLKQLMDRTGTCFEDAWLTTFHRQLVELKNFKEAEEMLMKAADDGVFERHCMQSTGVLRWTEIKPSSVSQERNTSEDLCWPIGRGGHDMCVDSEQGFLYLFGGWDGRTDLGDLWRFNIRLETWECLSLNTENEGGPSARSCHQMCMDVSRQRLYVMGRFYSILSKEYDEQNSAGNFYCYDIPSRTWTELSASGVPICIYDHRMCFDESHNRIFVFGGRRRRTGPLTNQENEYSGLYRYDVESGNWTMLRSGSEPGDGPLAGRVSHGMALVPSQTGGCQLVVFGGQREGSPGRFHGAECYDPSTDKVELLPVPLQNNSSSDEAGNGFNSVQMPNGSVECIYDQDRHELRICPSVFGGDVQTTTPPPTVKSHMQNFLVAFSLKDMQLSWISDVQDPGPRTSESGGWPQIRSMHSFVYDPKSKAHFVFGGHDCHQNGRERLDDLWRLTIERPTHAAILRRAILDIRKLRCLHLASSDLPAAIRYLQSDVGSFVDKTVEEEREELHSLCNEVFQVAHDTRSGVDQDDSSSPTSLIYYRKKLFQRISSYFPQENAAPRSNLKEVVSIDKDALFKFEI